LKTKGDQESMSCPRVIGGPIGKRKTAEKQEKPNQVEGLWAQGEKGVGWGGSVPKTEKDGRGKNHGNQ